jgi:hypothetical protein
MIHTNHDIAQTRGCNLLALSLALAAFPAGQIAMTRDLRIENVTIVSPERSSPDNVHSSPDGVCSASAPLPHGALASKGNLKVQKHRRRPRPHRKMSRNRR